MTRLSFKRHHFPGEVILHTVWLHFRFTLSLRDVEEMLAQRGIDVTYETIRCWVDKFGPKIAANLRRRRAPPSPRWHLDEMVCKIGGERMYLWRAVDDEGEVMDMIVQKRRDTRAALQLLRQSLRNSGIEPQSIVTDGLKSYACALDGLGLEDRHRPTRLRENTAPKTRISRSDDANERCSASSRKLRLSASSKPTPPSTTFSIFSAT